MQLLYKSRRPRVSMVYRLTKSKQDVGRMHEDIENHSSLARNFQHPAWLIVPINHRNMWSIA